MKRKVNNQPKLVQNSLVDARGQVVLPYIPKLSEKLKSILQFHRIKHGSNPPEKYIHTHRCNWHWSSARSHNKLNVPIVIDVTSVKQSDGLSPAERSTCERFETAKTAPRYLKYGLEVLNKIDRDNYEILDIETYFTDAEKRHTRWLNDRNFVSFPQMHRNLQQNQCDFAFFDWFKRRM